MTARADDLERSIASAKRHGRHGTARTKERELARVRERDEVLARAAKVASGERFSLDMSGRVARVLLDLAKDAGL